MVFKGNDGGSTVTALTLDMSNAGKATFNSNVEVGAAVELTTAGKPIQVAGSSSNAWALGSSGGENAPGTASTTFAFHRWNGSAWNNAVEIDTNGIITPDTGTGGIKLGGAAAANLLDDYEEGTFDPTLTTDSGSVTMYTSYNTLAYTKVGRVVNITGMLALTSVSSPTGQIIFGNLPFTMANLTNRAGQARPTIHIYASGSGAPTQNKYYPAFIAFNEGSTSGLIVATYNATHDDSIADWFAAVSDIFANFSYITA
jgi:hypothetical protein